MTDDTATAASLKERALQPDRVYVGWQYARLYPDPGPPPRRPTPPEREQLSRGWIDKQRQEENLLNRPIKIVAGAAAACVVLFLLAWLTGLLDGNFAVLGAIASFFVLIVTGYAVWQGEQALRSRIEEERARIERIREKAQAELNAAQRRHAAAYREWERHRHAYETQKEWYPVSVPEGVDRLDVAGGTLAGWRAMVTMMGAARLDNGSRITVLDLSEGAVAGDLVALARDKGEDPLVWILPSDLPRLDLSSTLDAEALADVLSLVVSVSEEGPARDVSFDNAMLERVLTVFGGRAKIAQITAALRALAQVGDPREDIRLGLLEESQLEKLTTMFGRGADRVVIERAWALESQLRKLETLGTERARLPTSRLKVVSMDRRAGVFTNRVLGTYVVTALTHLLRTAPPQQPWGHTLFICGADKLRGDVLDRLVDACEATYTGLVLMYRAVPSQVKERLGRGNAAVGFMRLGNAEDARFASEHLGVGHRFEMARLTHGLGLTEPAGTGYASTVGPAEPDGPAGAETETLTEGILRSTDWGRTTTSALGESADADIPARAREFRVEQQQLQELPPTAMIFTHPTKGGREILLVDANPGILTLPVRELGQFDTGSPLMPPAPAAPRPASAAIEGATPAGSGSASGAAGPAGKARPASPARPAGSESPGGRSGPEGAGRTGRTRPGAGSGTPVAPAPAAPGRASAPAGGAPAVPGRAPAGSSGTAGITPRFTGFTRDAPAGPRVTPTPAAAEVPTDAGAGMETDSGTAARPSQPTARNGHPPGDSDRPYDRRSGQAGPAPSADPLAGATAGPASERPATPPRPAPPLRAGAARRTGTPPPLGLDRSADPQSRGGPPARPDPAQPEVESFVAPGEEPGPNLGPPKERLDFRRDRNRK